MSDWIILRCAGRSTLPLAQSLAEDGFRTWAPTAYLEGARPGEHIPAPILPTYVFAGLGHLLDLLALADGPHQHDGFSVMRRPGGFAMCREVELAKLRKEEENRRPKMPVQKQRARIAEKYAVGDTVRVPAGVDGFEGLQGVVEASDGHLTDLYLGGWVKLKIETFILRGDGVSEASQLAA